MGPWGSGRGAPTNEWASPWPPTHAVALFAPCDTMGWGRNAKRVLAARYENASRRRSQAQTRFLRIEKSKEGRVELQSAVANFVGTGKDGSRVRLDLVALVHVADEQYYKKIHERCGKCDRVLFEMITARENVHTDVHGRKTLKRRMFPTAQQIEMASAYGLKSQIQSMDCCREGWYLADLEKEVVQKLQENAREAVWGSSPAQLLAGNMVEALRLLVEGRSSGAMKSKLVRALLWITPCPEAGLLLLDWARQGGRPAPVLLPLASTLFALDLPTSRKLAFAQDLVSGQAIGIRANDPRTTLIGKRNEAAVTAVSQAIEDGCKHIAVLYGGLHMKDLARRLEVELDFYQTGEEWNVAWEVNQRPTALPALTGLFVASLTLLGIDALDWLDTLDFVVESWASTGPTAATLNVLLYLLRHAVIYLSLGRWLLEWDQELFQEEVAQHVVE
eukprot:scaffold2636_cov340-Pavlova_lutheri.AAC.123